MKTENNNRKKSRFSLRRLLILLFAGIAAVTLLAGCFSDNLIFQPQRQGMSPTADMIIIPVADKISITALWRSAPQAEYTLLYSHGNAEDLFDLRSLLPEYAGRGYNIIIYDYEGYGASPGKPGEKNCYRDIDAVYRYLTVTRGIAADKIIIYGRSVGSGPSCYLAEKSPAAALVLESPFMSAFRVVTGPIPMPFDKFNNIGRISSIKMPILIFHGRRDEVIAFSHGKNLYDAANQPKKFVEVPAAGHNDLTQVAGESYWFDLKNFLATLKPVVLPSAPQSVPAKPVLPKAQESPDAQG